MARAYAIEGRYRYRLQRDLGSLFDTNAVAFCMLNPSTATADVSDPTVRRCERYAESWGFGRLLIVNLFGLRATDPREITFVDDPVGPENDAAILEAAREADEFVAAWGNHGRYRDRDADVLALLAGVPVKCLGRTKAGCPVHPLYQPKDAVLEPYAGVDV